jgi:para-aminobenzoate synthetase / 4-amino-4-deoxychorismate lyase
MNVRAPYTPLPFNDISVWLEGIDEFILLESNLRDPAQRYSYLFIQPAGVLASAAASPDEIGVLFGELDAATADRYAAGWISYEAGYALHPKLKKISDTRPASYWFGLFDAPFRFDHAAGAFEPELPHGAISRRRGGSFDVENIRPRVDKHRYRDAVERVRQYIREGYTYQANFTMGLDFVFSGSPTALYASLRMSQPTAYSALIRRGDSWILSFSPELFFRIENGIITAKPMKGTMPRGRTNEEDAAIVRLLENDEKNRAENLMIVDLLRNDIGRIAGTGSVRVPKLFEIETYRTVYQMTSTVMGTLIKGSSWLDIFTSMFPCGSVTGAPKLRTMEIIHELEPHPRGVYTGAIGMIAPGGDAVFNVPIRTVVLAPEVGSSADSAGGGLPEGSRRGTMGIGSGIVWDSNTDQEYDECMLKAHFLTERYASFQLVESLRFENGYRREGLHIERLMDSARYFSIPVAPEAIEATLHNAARYLDPTRAYKVRLTLSEDGRMHATAEVIAGPPSEPVPLMLCRTPIDPSDRYIYHKTTRRGIYDAAYAQASKAGCFDVVFFNTNNEITEGARTNVYIERDGAIVTPPVSCGLLNGICRRELLASGKVTEGVITQDEFLNAERIYVSNAVRGFLRALLAPEIVEHSSHLQ